jgi:cytochrome c553
MRVALAMLVALAAGLGAPVRAEEGGVAHGRALYAQCAACHGSDGRSVVMPQYPKIGGQNLEYLSGALKAYRDGRRQGTYASIMSAAAKGLSDADIADLAAYVASL